MSRTKIVVVEVCYETSETEKRNCHHRSFAPHRLPKNKDDTLYLNKHSLGFQHHSYYKHDKMLILERLHNLDNSFTSSTISSTLMASLKIISFFRFSNHLNHCMPNKKKTLTNRIGPCFPAPTFPTKK